MLSKIVLIVLLLKLAYANLLGKEWLLFTEKYLPNHNNLRIDKQAFTANLNTIIAHNEEYNLGLHSYKKGINKFSGMPLQDALDSITCFNSKSLLRHSLILANTITPEAFNFNLADNTVPDQIDFRKIGAVTEVKNQRECGSCWAFSTTGVLEGQHFLVSRKLIALSEQQLVDCSKGDQGCDGGSMDSALGYIAANGIASEQSYPYKGEQSLCRYNNSTMKVKSLEVAKHTVIYPGNEKILKKLVAHYGPVSVAMEVNKDLASYSSGIFYSPNCLKSVDGLNHAVLVVGYGTDRRSHQDYWIVKNSWGKDFGERGYMKLARNRDNNCNIATIIAVPFLK